MWHEWIPKGPKNGMAKSNDNGLKCPLWLCFYLTVSFANHDHGDTTSIMMNLQGLNCWSSKVIKPWLHHTQAIHNWGGFPLCPVNSRLCQALSLLNEHVKRIGPPNDSEVFENWLLRNCTVVRYQYGEDCHSFLCLPDDARIEGLNITGRRLANPPSWRQWSRLP